MDPNKDYYKKYLEMKQIADNMFNCFVCGDPNNESCGRELEEIIGFFDDDKIWNNYLCKSLIKAFDLTPDELLKEATEGKEENAAKFIVKKYRKKLNFDIALFEHIKYMNERFYWDTELEIVKTLIRAKADVNYTDKDKCSSLMNAVSIKSEHLVKFLLDHKADVNFKDARGNTALKLAKNSTDNDNIYKLLLKNKPVNEDLDDKKKNILVPRRIKN